MPPEAPAPGASPGEPDSIGPYRVLALIGRAGQTAVYRCAATAAGGASVAVKLFPQRLAESPAAIERFRDEMAELIRVSRSPGLVRYLETGRQGDRLYLVMEWVEGKSLDRELRERRLALPEVFVVMKGLCRALATVHGQGRVHGGITPRNLLLSSDLKAIKLAGLGLVPFETASQASLTGTLSTGEIRLGAMYYLAPETFEGDGKDVDARADLYSAGALFHEMLTGRAPGARFSLPSQLDAELPPELDPIALRCLARRKEERYASAAELLADIERVEESLRLRLLSEIKGLTLQGPARRKAPEEGEARKRSPLLLIGLGSLLLIALGIAGYLMMK